MTNREVTVKASNGKKYVLETVAELQGHKVIRIKVGDLVQLLPYDAQFVNGQKLIKQTRVQSLRKNIRAALQNPESPITLTEDLRVVQGNHRVEASRLELEEGGLNPNMVVEAHMHNVKPDNEILFHAYNGNHGQAKTNFKAFSVHSSHPVAKKLNEPAFRVMESVLGKAFTQNTKEAMALKLAAALNKNKTELRKLDKYEPLNLNGFDLYVTKSDDTANKEFINVDPSTITIDLNGYVDQLVKILQPVREFVKQTKVDGDMWKDVLGNNYSFLFPLIGASLRKRIICGNQASGSSNKSVKALIGAFKRNGSKIREKVRTYTSDPQVKEAAILRLLGL